MVMCKHCFQRVRHLFFIFCQQQSHIGSPYFGNFQDSPPATGRFSDIIPPLPQCDPARRAF